MSKAGTVYIIKSGDYYKVGHTSNFPNRINQYSTQNPHGIEVVTSFEVEDCWEIEKEIMKMLCDSLPECRVKDTEWFLITKGTPKPGGW